MFHVTTEDLIEFAIILAFLTAAAAAHLAEKRREKAKEKQNCTGAPPLVTSGDLPRIQS
jgi:hypothetical protein